MAKLLSLFVLAESLIRAILAGAPSREARRGVREALTLLKARAIGTPDKPGAAWDAIADAYKRAARDAQNAPRGDATARSGARHRKSAERLYRRLADRLDAAIAHVAIDIERGFGSPNVGKGEIPEVKGFTDKGGKRWDLSVYARMCARTTAAEARSEATVNTLVDRGVDLVTVSKHPHPNDVCSRFEGRVYSISGGHPRYTKLRERPPFHPNCLLPGQFVSAPGLETSSERWYEGEIVIIRTSEGDELTCTLNHPILTGRGWVAAGMIDEADKVVCSTNVERMVQSIDPDHDQMPALIEDVARSVGMAGDVPPRSVEITPEDFHGDGLGSEVAVVRSDSLLWDGVSTEALGEPDSQRHLNFRDTELAFLARAGTANLALKGVGVAAPSVVGGGSVSLPLVGAHSGISDARGFRAGWGGHDAHLLEPSVDGHFANAEFAGDVPFGLSPFVAFADVIEIERDTWSGHVYNLQTERGWYVCNNIITHNCRHVLREYRRAEGNIRPVGISDEGRIHVDTDAMVADVLDDRLMVNDVSEVVRVDPLGRVFVTLEEILGF